MQCFPPRRKYSKLHFCELFIQPGGSKENSGVKEAAIFKVLVSLLCRPRKGTKLC